MSNMISQCGRTMYFNDRHMEHRSNGPASIWDDSDWFWYLNGKSHRYYGPSNIFGDWSVHGIEIKRSIWR